MNTELHSLDHICRSGFARHRGRLCSDANCCLFAFRLFYQFPLLIKLDPQRVAGGQLAPITKIIEP